MKLVALVCEILCFEGRYVQGVFVGERDLRVCSKNPADLTIELNPGGFASGVGHTRAGDTEVAWRATCVADTSITRDRRRPWLRGVILDRDTDLSLGWDVPSATVLLMDEETCITFETFAFRPKYAIYWVFTTAFRLHGTGVGTTEGRPVGG